MKNLTLTLCLVALSFAFATSALANTLNSYELAVAAGLGDLAKVKKLIAKGMSPNTQDLIGGFGGTGLHSAAAAGHIDIVKYLLEQGAKIDARDKNGRTPLMWTVSTDKDAEEMIKLLLAKGADINKKDNAGKTVFDLARSGKRKDLIREYAKKQGQTAVHKCPHCGHTLQSGDSAHSAPSSRSAQGARRAQ